MSPEIVTANAKRIMSEIKGALKQWNYLRGVRVFTLGFEGAEEGFLKDLSKKHSGKYVRIL